MRRDAEAFEEKMKAEQMRKMAVLEEKKKAMQEEMNRKAQNSTDEERKMMIDDHEQVGESGKIEMDFACVRSIVACFCARMVV